ncbi:hypothetical protein ACVIW2_006475 [Bradyrhizobium huanghuaihaiense]
MRFLALLVLLILRTGMVAHLPVKGKVTRDARFAALP